VWDDGCQAGVDKGDQSSKGVVLPELEGSRCWGNSSEVGIVYSLAS